MKGKSTCKDFVTAIKEQFKRTDLVQQMEKYNDDVTRRGDHIHTQIITVVCHNKATYDIFAKLTIPAYL